MHKALRASYVVRAVFRCWRDQLVSAHKMIMKLKFHPWESRTLIAKSLRSVCNKDAVFV